jgi:hypothetical protein
MDNNEKQLNVEKSAILIIGPKGYNVQSTANKESPKHRVKNINPQYRAESSKYKRDPAAQHFI